MSETSIQSRPNPVPVLPSPAPPKPRSDVMRSVVKVFKALASLRLTVFLFSLSMLLVFCGTLAMMDQGLATVLSRYFRSFVAWIPLQLFVRFGQVFFGVSPGASLSGSIPFPGGWTIGAVLLVNLLAAHAVRFRFTWRRSGVLILHLGVIVLMLGELVTGLFAVESSMSIPLGGSSNFVESFDRLELAFVSPADEQHDNVVVVPASMLQKGGTIQNDELPVAIEVLRYLPNSRLAKDAPATEANLATKGFGLQTGVIELPRGRGVDADMKRDAPSAYITLKDKNNGKSLGTYLVSFWLNPQKVAIDGTDYQIALRATRSYRSYTFKLEQLKHENFHGTSLAKRYASLVHVTDPEHGEDRDVLIHMNHPFYYQGETFYQSSVTSNRDGLEFTGLQVVRNPGWPLPYIACTLVCLGMLVHFLLHLSSFFGRMVTP